MFGHLLESSHRYDSYKWSNIGFGEELTQVVSIEVNFTHLIWHCVVISMRYVQSKTFYTLLKPNVPFKVRRTLRYFK